MESILWTLGGIAFAIAAFLAWRSDKKSGNQFNTDWTDTSSYEKSEDWFQDAKARLRIPRF